MLHCNLIIDEKPNAIDGAQAHMEFPYNARLIFCVITCCSKHYNILQTPSSLNLLGFSNTCFVVYGIFQHINAKSVAKNKNYKIVQF